VLSGRSSAWGLSPVQRTPTEDSMSECDREASTVRRPWSTRDCFVMEKIALLIDQVYHKIDLLVDQVYHKIDLLVDQISQNRPTNRSGVSKNRFTNRSGISQNRSTNR
jgi:hypothetical protein